MYWKYKSFEGRSVSNSKWIDVQYNSNFKRWSTKIWNIFWNRFSINLSRARLAEFNSFKECLYGSLTDAIYHRSNLTVSKEHESFSLETYRKAAALQVISFNHSKHKTIKKKRGASKGTKKKINGTKEITITDYHPVKWSHGTGWVICTGSSSSVAYPWERFGPN